MREVTEPHQENCPLDNFLFLLFNSLGQLFFSLVIFCQNSNFYSGGDEGS